MAIALTVIGIVGLAMSDLALRPVAVGEVTVAPGFLHGAAAAAISLSLAIAHVTVRRRAVLRERHATFRELAQHDPLTGLANRQLLNTWSGLDERPPDALGHPCVLLVDLDRFKYVNDTHWYRFGDQLLTEVAARLRANVRTGDTVVRIGGDEFLVLCRDVLSESTAERVAMRLVHAIQAPIAIGAERVRISASVGIAIADQPGIDLDHLIHHADRAVARAKAAQPGTVAIASGDDVAVPLVTEAELQRAIDLGELRLHYQPLVRLSDGELVGVEALLRWEHPIHGLLPPGAFLPLLEESGLIVPAGTWVLHQAALQARRWQASAGGRPALKVSVNVSPRQLGQADFTETAQRAILDSGARATNLCLEVTEGALLRDPAAAWTSLRQLKHLGVSLALDDFGTGFSSLSHLRRFDLDVLKIDRSFVTNVHESEEDRAIVRQVIGLAHALGMTAVAEGIEDPGQADVLRKLGCDQVQGYLYSRPVTVDIIDTMLEEGRSLMTTPWLAALNA